MVRVGSLVLAGMMLVACATTNPSSDASGTADGPTSQEGVPQGQFGDDGLREIDSVQFAVMVVTATVVETHGPEVSVTENDLVDYDLDDEAGFPSVTVQVDGPSTELQRENSYAELMTTVRDAIDSSGTVELQHANGKLEVGRQYALFVGPWEPELANIFYAFDVSDDRPAAGFRSDFEEVKAQILRAAEGLNRFFDTDLELVTAFAQDLQPNQDPRTGMAALPFGEPTEVTDPFEDAYPIDAIDSSASDREGLVRVRVVISNANPGDIFGLQGERRILGWFRTNNNRRALITGFVDPDASYEVVQQSGTQVGQFDIVPGGRFDVGHTGARVQIEVFENGQLEVVENEAT